MLFFSALALGMITGFPNVTSPSTEPVDLSTEITTTELSSSGPHNMGLAETSKLPGGIAEDFVNVTIHERPIWDVYLNSCPKWRPMNHIFFQVANICFLLSFLAPHTPSGLVWLRVALMLGCAFSAAWAWTVECYLDAVLWNGAFILINFVYFAVHFYLIRPIKFNKEIEEVSSFLFIYIGRLRVQSRIPAIQWAFFN